jgi:iron complex transport system substrate-binding protein
MKRSTIVLWILIAGCLYSSAGVFFGLFLPALRSAMTKQPDSGAPHDIRIISLSPSTTEMVFLLGMGKSLVGVTEYCDYPPEAKMIERVGGFGKPNIEVLLALSPSLVVSTGLDRNNVFPLLKKSGIRAMDVKIASLDDMFQALRDIGDAVGRRARADEVIAAMQAELRTIAGQLPDPKNSPPPRVFVELWDDPLTTVGRGSFLDDVIARAGGVNIAHEMPQPHLHISAEKVIEWDPNVIIIAHMARNPGSAAAVGKRIGWSNVTAVKEDRVLCDIPSDLILRPGPRLIDAVKLLSKRLHETAPKMKPTSNKAD